MDISQQQVLLLTASSGQASNNGSAGAIAWTAIRWGQTVFLYFMVDVTGNTNATCGITSALPVGFRPPFSQFNWVYFTDGSQSLYFSGAGNTGNIIFYRRQITAASGFIQANTLGTEQYAGSIAYLTHDPWPAQANASDPFVQSSHPIQVFSGGGANSTNATSAGNWSATKIGRLVLVAASTAISGNSASATTYNSALPAGWRPYRNCLTQVTADTSLQSFYFMNMTTDGNLYFYRRQMTAAGGWVATDFVGSETLTGGLFYII